MATGKTWAVSVPITKEGGTWGYITAYFQEDYDILGNYSTLRVTKMTGSNSIRSGNFISVGSISINGSPWYSWHGQNWVFGGLAGESEFMTWSGASYPSGLVIYHNDDGNKTISVSLNISYCGREDGSWTGNGGTVTNSVALTMIPRASSITATDANIGSVSQITVTRKATMYSHTIRYTFGSLSGYIDASGNAVSSAVKMDTTSIGFTVPTTFYTQIPNAKTGNCTLTITTYSGSTQIGSAQTCAFTVTAAQSLCTPTVTGTVVDVNSETIALTGSSDILVRYMSDALCTITATALNSASVSTKTIGGITVTENTRTITGIESDTVTFAATDSRGYSNSVDVTKNFISYIKLTNNSTAVRPDPVSGKVTLTIQGSCFNGNFGAADNVVTAKYSIDGGSYTNATVTMNGNTYSVTLNLTGFNYQSSYSIEVVVSDKLMTVNKTLPVQKGIPVFDWGEDDFNFNVPVNVDGALSVGGYVNVKGLSIENGLGLASGGTGARTAAAAVKNIMLNGANRGYDIAIDFDNIPDYGFIWCALTNNDINPPSGLGAGNYGWLENYPTFQRFCQYGTNRIHTRYHANGIWNPWFCNGGAVEMKLLWENASLGSTFTAHDVYVDLSGYQRVRIDFYPVAGNMAGWHYSVYSFEGRVGDRIRGSTSCSDNADGNTSNWISHRQAQTGTYGVSFGPGGYTRYTNGESAGNNDYCIPYRIYGIKGVT